MKLMLIGLKKIIETQMWGSKTWRLKSIMVKTVLPISDFSENRIQPLMLFNDMLWCSSVYFFPWTIAFLKSLEINRLLIFYAIRIFVFITALLWIFNFLLSCTLIYTFSYLKNCRWKFANRPSPSPTAFYFYLLFTLKLFKFFFIFYLCWNCSKNICSRDCIFTKLN